MPITATKLRENIYKILDEAIKTGEPIEVIRNGQILRIVPEKRASKLDRLEKHDCFIGDPDDVAGMDWSTYWTGNDDLP